MKQLVVPRGRTKLPGPRDLMFDLTVARTEFFGTLLYGVFPLVLCFFPTISLRIFN